MGKVLMEYLSEPNDLNSTTFEGIIVIGCPLCKSEEKIIADKKVL